MKVSVRASSHTPRESNIKEIEASHPSKPDRRIKWMLQDAEFLLPIVSLGEFMESLNVELPFENLPVDAGKVTPFLDKDDFELGFELKRITNNEESVVKHDTQADVNSTVMHAEVKSTESSTNFKSSDRHVKSEIVSPTGISKGDHVWQPGAGGSFGNWQENRGFGVAVQPWNDDEDNI
ncbi:hypothetical protein CJ030_MR3G009412 [Morella rubra]|uniref:Uncharacterized protein n=1 Tax=Morella rubra TaxID=262757 RepID=A0A6A1WAB4_9ROSI|nr:hypothetical protein CJ030_MR3G009412 [Morella rubra]